MSSTTKPEETPKKSGLNAHGWGFNCSPIAGSARRPSIHSHAMSDSPDSVTG